ncbi:hypothetical protein PVT67_03950 [Gallaecimonas kandeliae]|uniref:hypothetical protein n=1 Tax=Gallaecimonas kandeliae TaxID=3029055 RepID=UPI002647767F|nr:hypothetical protein [Gallaecimonas kandeliae]WKE66415.1 hypothetical protein PVT67_03950 [Gallaecimonas kandeliae]
MLLIPLWWVRLPPLPRLIWVDEAGCLRLDGQVLTAQRVMKSPLLVMLKAGGRWYWLYRAEFAEADWRRLKRCLR